MLYVGVVTVRLKGLAITKKYPLLSRLAKYTEWPTQLFLAGDLAVMKSLALADLSE